MRAQLGSTPFPVWGRSSSFYTFFQASKRGQHLCLAQVERSSSHTNFGVCSHFVSVSTQTTCDCVVRFLKKCLQHPFAPTLPRRAAQGWAPFQTPCTGGQTSLFTKFKIFPSFYTQNFALKCLVMSNFKSVPPGMDGIILFAEPSAHHKHSTCLS